MGKWDTFAFFPSSPHWDIWKIFTQAGKKGIILGGANFLSAFSGFLLLNIVLNISSSVARVLSSPEEKTCMYIKLKIKSHSYLVFFIWSSWKWSAKAQLSDLWKSGCREGPSYFPNLGEYSGDCEHPRVAQTSGGMYNVACGHQHPGQKELVLLVLSPGRNSAPPTQRPKLVCRGSWGEWGRLPAMLCWQMAEIEKPRYIWVKFKGRVVKNVHFHIKGEESSCVVRKNISTGKWSHFSISCPDTRVTQVSPFPGKTPTVSAFRDAPSSGSSLPSVEKVQSGMLKL